MLNYKENHAFKIGISKLSDFEKDRLRILIIEKYLAGFEQGKKEGIEQTAKYIAGQKASASYADQSKHC